MWFWLFRKACRKYGFSVTLSTRSGACIILKPCNRFDNIELTNYYYNYNNLFKKAIKSMKEYKIHNR